MKKYYKVNIYSENIDMGNYNSSIIVEKGLIYAKEVVTDAKIMMCDNKTQGSMYDYYVLSFDFKPENIARYDEVKKYIENFELSTFPVYSSLEAKKIKKIGKKKINING
mgnify:CR=1 FL=1